MKETMHMTQGLAHNNWIPRQAGRIPMTTLVLGNSLGEVAYLHCPWNLLLYPLKMSKQGRNFTFLFFLPLANNDISNPDNGKVLSLKH